LNVVAAGDDPAPLLLYPPSPDAIGGAAAALASRAEALAPVAPTEAASHYSAASLFFSRAGLAENVGQMHSAAFDCVSRAVEKGIAPPPFPLERWCCDEIRVEAPVRLDFGGGWSDTPPFSLDCGGTVLNAAVLLNGAYPIRVAVRRLPEPLVRCVSEQTGAVLELRTCADILSSMPLGDEFSIARAALRVSGFCSAGRPLRDILSHMGGGIEIRAEANLPMGSGLGTSSILAAATLRALWEFMGMPFEPQTLWDSVLRLEQLMGTGGGWQDQVGGGTPGVKLLSSTPGFAQRIHVEALDWSPQRQSELHDRLVVYYTGIRRIARDLLRQVVDRYLRRESAAVEVLHTIKTLAVDMSVALREGDWERLGGLLDRHWELNQVLDPNTTNPCIDRLLAGVRPFVYGAKLAGAGGGGFLILVARNPQAARHAREFLARDCAAAGGAVYDAEIARTGFRLVRS
jgi:fucokinase